MRRFTVAVDEDTAARLAVLARAERRDPREQAALLLEGALARLSSEANRQARPGSKVPVQPPLCILAEPDAR